MTTVRTLLRCFFTLILWVGVSSTLLLASPATVPAGAAQTTATTSGAELQARLLVLLGGEGICGEDDGPADNILCGGDLLTSLVHDQAVLWMSRGMCSRLLEQLYSRELCTSDREDCDVWHHDAVPPPTPRVLLAGGGAAFLRHHNASLQPHLAHLRPVRARDDPEPTSRNTGPPPPPPRILFA